MYIFTMNDFGFIPFPEVQVFDFDVLKFKFKSF